MCAALALFFIASDNALFIGDSALRIATMPYVLELEKRPVTHKSNNDHTYLIVLIKVEPMQ